MATNSIIKVDNNVAVNWGAVTSATKYHLRISRKYDFSTIEVQNSNIATTLYTAVISSGNYKYYYQFRPYVTSWQAWRDVESFERVTSGADLTITSGKWIMFEVSERATYTLVFDHNPVYEYSEEQLWRTAERNLAGDILSEFYTTKGRLTLEWREDNTLSATEKNQIMRYYGNNSGSVYVACANYDGSDYFRNLWNVHFSQPPTITHIGGNESRYMMRLELEER